MNRLTLAALLMLALPVAAQTYRWVDDKGQVHYSQFPPKQGTYGTVAPPPPPLSSPNQDSINEALKEGIEQEPIEAARAAQAAKVATERKSRCQQARYGLAELDRVPAQRLLKTDEQGNVSRSTEEDVRKRRDELERSASSNCG